MPSPLSPVCSDSASAWRSAVVEGYLVARSLLRAPSGAAEVSVRHIGHRAWTSEIGSKGTGSSSTSTIVMGAASVVAAQVAMQKLHIVCLHVVVTGSWSNSWQIGHKSSSSTSSSFPFELLCGSGFATGAAVSGGKDSVISFLRSIERLARRAARLSSTML